MDRINGKVDKFSEETLPSIVNRNNKGVGYQDYAYSSLGVYDYYPQTFDQRINMPEYYDPGIIEKNANIQYNAIDKSYPDFESNDKLSRTTPLKQTSAASFYRIINSFHNNKQNSLTEPSI